MEHLWAPWRMQFIEDLRNRKDGCLFCELGAAGDDRSRFVLGRTRLCYAVLNRYPYNNGHLMIVPFRHTGSLADLSTEEHAEMLGLCSRAVEILREQLHAEGFNCGFNLGQAAGAGITDHVHLHVVPRWCGDANFLPVIAQTRALPQLLDESRRLIADAWAARV